MGRRMWAILAEYRSIDDPRKTFWLRVCYTKAENLDEAFRRLKPRFSYVRARNLVQAWICRREGRRWIKVKDITSLVKKRKYTIKEFVNNVVMSESFWHDLHDYVERKLLECMDVWAYGQGTRVQEIGLRKENNAYYVVIFEDGRRFKVKIDLKSITIRGRIEIEEVDFSGGKIGEDGCKV